MSETHARSVLKAVSWRITASLITIAATFLLTGRIEIALSIGLLDSAAKILTFYLHERVWARIGFGMKGKAAVLIAPRAAASARAGEKEGII